MPDTNAKVFQCALCKQAVLGGTYTLLQHFEQCVKQHSNKTVSVYHETKQRSGNDSREEAKADTLQSIAAGQVLDKLNHKLTNFSDLLIGQIKASPAFKEIESMIAALKQSICTSDQRESYYYSKVDRCVQTFQWEHKKMLCDLVDCDPMLQVRTELARMANHELQREWSDILQQSSTARLLHEVYDGNGVKELMYAHTLHGPIGWSIYDDLVPTMKQVVDAKDIVYGSFRFPVVDWSAYDEKELLLVAFLGIQ